MKRVYLCGKIGNLSKEEYTSKFKKWEQHFSNTHIVINPIDLPHNHDKQWHSYMLEDLQALTTCHAIAVMPCYKDSPGALIEIVFAQKAGKEIIYL